MTVSSKRTTSPVALSTNSYVGDRAIGLVVAMSVPATFWTFAMASAGMLAGYPIPTALLLIVAIAIVVFLAFVCSPLILGNVAERARR